MKTNIFLDSGAYSAWRQFTPLNNEDYTEYVLERKDKFGVVAGLDMIPGRRGKNPTQEQVDIAAKESWNNANYMMDAGVPCLPTYHMGEDRKWLCKMLSGKFKYIALGTTGSASIRDRQNWLDDLFSNYLTDDDGYPVIKVHGFAVFCDHAYRYPWYSCDSTTARIWASNGLIFAPKLVDGKYDYTVPFDMMIPSEAHIKETSKTMVGEVSHVYNMRKAMTTHGMEKIRLQEFVQDELKMDVESIRSDANVRHEANIITALRVEEGITSICRAGERRLSPKIKAASRARNAFWHSKPQGIINKGLDFTRFKYYFAGSLGRGENKLYTKCGAKNRLISYFYLSGAGKKPRKYDLALDEIVNTGLRSDAKTR